MTKGNIDLTINRAAAMDNGQVMQATSPLQNQRHELFALGLVEGKTADQAYTDAGYKPNRKNASRLKTNEGIRNRVAKLQAHHQQRHDVTVDSLTEEYEEARDLAMNIEQPSAAISATSGKAKLHGFDKAESVQVNIQQNVKITKLELARRMANIIQRGTIPKISSPISK